MVKKSDIYANKAMIKSRASGAFIFSKSFKLHFLYSVATTKRANNDIDTDCIEATFATGKDKR